jgi:hypothetical protein
MTGPYKRNYINLLEGISVFLAYHIPLPSQNSYVVLNIALE